MNHFVNRSMFNYISIIISKVAFSESVVWFAHKVDVFKLCLYYLTTYYRVLLERTGLGGHIPDYIRQFSNINNTII